MRPCLSTAGRRNGRDRARPVPPVRIRQLWLTVSLAAFYYFIVNCIRHSEDYERSPRSDGAVEPPADALIRSCVTESIGLSKFSAEISNLDREVHPRKGASPERWGRRARNDGRLSQPAIHCLARMKGINSEQETGHRRRRDRWTQRVDEIRRSATPVTDLDITLIDEDFSHFLGFTLPWVMRGWRD